ncbi:transposase [Paucilactobacillus hokkaidonensis JCM 18461]|uniref:Transposase n=3 Tax=Paucilactobacillus hokkaidonensis TaxID=1193095 RepID=A0A0A1GT72_9LACO|nr:IS110 family transposase [Paucilactobacillus hokkaidonensis]KRO11300.1 transposase [Paucilactobacillus hokkaidonensis]BAP85150.1 transposase [Paucilactobacillus hokkaidonensis JCM 18461]
MDVHKASISLCALDDETGEIIGETKCANDPKLVVKFVKTLKKKVDAETTFRSGYEAGCLGYALCKGLTKLGISCDIMAPTTMYNSSKHKMVKNDRMDAKMIARNLASGTYKSVYIPDEEDLDVKEYVRMRKDFILALKKIKQEIGALTLRHGYSYSLGKSRWTIAYFKWLDDLPLSRMLRMTLDEYVIQYEELTKKIKRFDQQIEELSHNVRFEEPVQKLRCIKGIDTSAGMTIQVEISDFSRFPTAQAFSSYLGLTPSEHSSGEHTRNGAITKQGNRTVRSTLIECVNSLAKGKVGHKSKRINARQKGQPARIISYADQATERLQRKFYRMIDSGKPRNVAITAAARELACFIWGIETNNV